MGGSIVTRQLLLLFAILLLSANTLARRPGGGSGGSSSGSGGSSGGSGGSSSGSGGSSTGSGGGSSTGTGGGTNTGTGGSTGGLHTYPPSNGWSGTSYRPPQQIQHGSNSFPVSTTPPPTYVYVMRDSGSRYNNLLTGLMLWNLGRRPRTTNQNNDDYQGQPGEVCKFRMRNNSTVEDRRIECRSISSFIWEWENQGNGTVAGNTTAGVGDVIVTQHDGSNLNGTAVMDAMDDKGDSILVTPGMTCYIIRILRTSTTSQQVDCQLLQLYTANSWNSNGAKTLAPALMIILVFQALLFQI